MWYSLLQIAIFQPGTTFLGFVCTRMSCTLPTYHEGFSCVFVLMVLQKDAEWYYEIFPFRNFFLDLSLVRYFYFHLILRNMLLLFFVKGIIKACQMVNKVSIKLSR